MQNQAVDSKGRLKHITGGEAILLTEAIGGKLRDWINEGEAQLPPTEIWDANNKERANAAVKAYVAAGGKAEEIGPIKAKGLSPSETIKEIETMTTNLKEAK